MKNIRLYALIILSFSCTFLLAQKGKKSFKPEVEITYWDGSSIQLADFELHGPHYRPDFYYDMEHKDKMDIPIKDAYKWQLKKFDEIDKIVFDKQEDKAAWLSTIMILSSGDTLKGETPTAPRYMWESGNKIKLYAESKVMGKLGEINYRIDEIKEISRKGKEYKLISVKEEVKTIYNPYLAHYAYGRAYIFNNYSYGHTYMSFLTEGIKIKIFQSNIDSISFQEDGKSIFLRLKDDNEGSGQFEKKFLHFKGKTADGFIWYQPVYVSKWFEDDKGRKRSKTVADIKSIKFL